MGYFTVGSTCWEKLLASVIEDSTMIGGTQHPLESIGRSGICLCITGACATSTSQCCVEDGARRLRVLPCFCSVGSFMNCLWWFRCACRGRLCLSHWPSLHS